MCLAIPGKVVEWSGGESDCALVDVMGVRRKVDLGLLQDNPPKPGEWVLIHVGFAMSKISDEEALDQMRMLTLLGEQQAAIDEVAGYAMDDGTDRGASGGNGTGT